MCGTGKRKVPRKTRAILAPQTVRFTVREYKDYHKRKHASIVPPVRDIDSSDDRDTKVKPWVYVFTVESWGVRLRYEAQVEGEDSYKLVNWSKKSWAKKDKRAATVKINEFVIKGARHSSEMGIYVMLSRIQLPIERLKKYYGNTEVNKGGPNLVRRRCTKLDLNDRTNLDEKPDKDPLKNKTYVLHLPEPILMADKVKATYNKTLLELQKHKEKDDLKHELAGLCLKILPSILKEEDDFATPGSGDDGKAKFDKAAAEAVVRRYKAREKSLTQRREELGKILDKVTDNAVYDEAIRDHDGVDAFEDERIRIEARHATGKMQSQATRKQMQAQLKDANSRILEYMTRELLFNSARKFTNLVAEFGDLLGEYGHILVKIKSTTEVIAFVQKSTRLRIGLNLIQYTKRTTVGVAVIRTYRIDTQVLAGSPDFKGRLSNYASKLLVVFEALNFAMALDAFRSTRNDRKITDWAGPIGSLMDLTGAVGRRALAALEKSERELAAAANLTTYQKSRKLVIWGRVMAVVGVLGGIMDMIEARSSALKSAETLSFEEIVCSVAMFSGAAIGIYATVLGGTAAEGSLAAAAAGPIGWVAIGMVLIGVLIIMYFKQSPLEKFFRNSTWGDRTIYSSDHEGYGRQMSVLNRLLATFRVNFEYVNLRQRNFFWQSDSLQVTIQPGYATANSKWTVETKGWVQRGSPPFYDYGYELLDSRTVTSKIDRKGKIQPIIFHVHKPLNKQVRVVARLDVNGDRKFMVPKNEDAWWTFILKESERKAVVMKAHFPD